MGTTKTLTKSLMLPALLAALLCGSAAGCRSYTEQVTVAASVADYRGDMLDVQLPAESEMREGAQTPVVVEVRRTAVDWDTVGDVTLTTLEVICLAAWYSLEVVAHCCAAACK